MTGSTRHQKKVPQPKYVTAKDGSAMYGVHRDFFRKTHEIRRYRVVLNKRTHLYPVDKLDAYFKAKGAD